MPPKSMDRWLFGNFSHPAAQRCPGTLRQHLPPRCSPRKLGKKPPCSHTALQSPVARERCWQPSLSCPCEGNGPGRRCPGAGVPWQGGLALQSPPGPATAPARPGDTDISSRHFQETFPCSHKAGAQNKRENSTELFLPLSSSIKSKAQACRAAQAGVGEAFGSGASQGFAFPLEVGGLFN